MNLRHFAAGILAMTLLAIGSAAALAAGPPGGDLMLKAVPVEAECLGATEPAQPVMVFEVTENADLCDPVLLAVADLCLTPVSVAQGAPRGASALVLASCSASGPAPPDE